MAVEQMIWCGECTPCRNGLPDYCRYIEELGVTLLISELNQMLAFAAEELASYARQRV